MSKKYKKFMKVGRRYKSRAGNTIDVFAKTPDGRLAAVLLETGNLMSFDKETAVDGVCWEEIHKPVEAWAVVECDTDEVDSVSSLHEEAEEILSELDPDLYRIAHLREVT